MTMDPDEVIIYPLMVATCHTDDCENFEKPITLACAGVVTCGGGCGNQITDIVDA